LAGSEKLTVPDESSTRLMWPKSSKFPLPFKVVAKPDATLVEFEQVAKKQ